MNFTYQRQTIYIGTISYSNYFCVKSGQVCNTGTIRVGTCTGAYTDGYYTADTTCCNLNDCNLGSAGKEKELTCRFGLQGGVPGYQTCPLSTGKCAVINFLKTK